MAPMRGVGAYQLERMLGDWRATGRSAATGRSTGTGRTGRWSDYAALAAAVRGLIRDGRLALQVRLPAERALAEALGASRTTVTAAYRSLRADGYLTSRRGSGSYTALPDGQRLSTAGVWAPIDDGLIDLGAAAPPAPAQLGPAALAAAAQLPRYAEGHGYYPAGLPELRAAVADRFSRRGVPTNPTQIMITSGAVQAFDLVLRLLVAPGERVLVESPSYPNALSAIAQSRARVETVGVGPHGWDDDLLLSALTAGRPRLAYLIPDFQNPTGHLMTGPLRERLAAAAHAAGSTLVVDETFVDLVLDPAPEPPPSMATVDRHARVITIGGLSKAYWGGLRIGWVRAAPSVIRRLTAVRSSADIGGPVLDQLIAVGLLADDDQILADRRRFLIGRRDALAAAVTARLPDWHFTLPAGGLTLWVELDEPISGALSRAAEDYGVRLAPGSRFGAEGTLERFVRLPFTLPVPTLEEAVRLIAAAREDLDRGPLGRWDPSPVVVA